MKRQAASVILLLSAALLFSSPAVSYAPSIGILGGAKVTAFNESAERRHNARLNGTLCIKADPLAMRIDSSRVSIPFYISYDFASGSVSYMTTEPRVSASLRIEYSIDINRFLLITLSAGPRYDWFYRIHGAMWYLDMMAGAGIRPADMISISFPVTVSVSAIGYEAAFSTALSVHLDGFFRKESRND